MTEDQAIMAAMRSERAGSSHNAPVARIPAPPAMTAAVERVSPSMCRKTVRMLTLPEERQRSAAMAPFIRTPAAATAIMMRGWTATGATMRWMAASAIQAARKISVSALTKAARTPAR